MNRFPEGFYGVVLQQLISMKVHGMKMVKALVFLMPAVQAVLLRCVCFMMK